MLQAHRKYLEKPVLSDERNNKTTYVTLYGMEKRQKNDTAEYVCKSIGNTQKLLDITSIWRI
mgnify:CR=1 FL=1